VLVVDSDDDVRNVIEELLIDHGFQVRQAPSPYDAAVELRNAVFDALVCHLEMLRQEDECLARRARELRPGLKVIAMSAGGSRATSDEADANLAKPFTRAQLLAILDPS
jgi:DNA-binding NtrC family response regulator